MIPPENKREYLEVLRLAPRLIKEESDPIKFLRAEDFNPWKSARSLVLYWQYRKNWFESRWLLPMNDSGAGALDQDDITLLKSGWITYAVPKDPQKGRFLIMNHGLYPTQATGSRVRVCFYICSAASDYSAQTVGVTGIRLIPNVEVNISAPRFQNARIAFTMLKEALPIRFKGVMLLSLEQSSIDRYMNLGFDQISSLIAGILKTQRPFTVAISDVSEAAEKLRPHGVPGDVLPPNHGGTWSPDRRFEWKRMVAEQDDIAKLVNIPWVTETVPIEEKAKEVNALYARRAYHKRKQKLTETQEEEKILRAENVKLRRENQLLEALMQQAADILALVEDEQLPDFDVADEIPGSSDSPLQESFGDPFADTWPNFPRY